MLQCSTNDKALLALPQSSFFNFSRLLLSGLILISSLNATSASAQINWPWKKRDVSVQQAVKPAPARFYDWRMPSKKTLRFIRSDQDEWSLASVFDEQGNLIDDCQLADNKKILKALPASSSSVPKELVGSNVHTQVVSPSSVKFSLLAEGQRWVNGVYEDDYLEVSEEILHAGPPIGVAKVETPEPAKKESLYTWEMPDGKKINFEYGTSAWGSYIKIHSVLDAKGKPIVDLNLTKMTRNSFKSLPVSPQDPQRLNRLGIKADPVMVDAKQRSFKLKGSVTNPATGDRQILEQEFNTDLLVSGHTDPYPTVLEEIKNTRKMPTIAELNPTMASDNEALSIAKSAQELPPALPAEIVASGQLKVTQGELIWVLNDGEEFKFYNNAELLKLQGSTYLTTKIIHANSAYLIVSVKPANAVGESFILRAADGVMTRLGPGLQDMMGITIVDGVLSIKSTLRKIDLDHFDLEATFKIIPTATAFSDITGYKDLGQELKLEPMIVDQPNEDLRKSIFRGLMQEELGSTVILGEGGTGKTTQVKAMIQETALGKTKLPRTWRFLEVTKTTLEANTSLVGQSSERVAALLKATEDVPTVLVMDEIHSFKGIGTHSNNSNDIFETLKDRLASGKLKIIGMSTQAEFYPAFAGNGPLLDRFKIYDQHPPKTNEEIAAILKSWGKRFRKVLPSTEVLNRIIDLSEEFNAMGYQPRKAISLLDQVYAELTLEGKMRTAPDLAIVEQVAAAAYNIGADHFDKVAMTKRVNELEDRIGKKIIGHEEAVKALVNLTAQTEAGLNSADKPAFVVMFPGPPGTGKTEIAKTYAAEIGLPLVKIEMSQYAHGKPVEDLLKEISAALRKNAKSVILLDEFEKAHITIQNGVLSMFDSGKFNVSESLGANPNSGKRTFAMSARHARFILATNAGTDVIQANTNTTTGEMRINRKDLVEDLKKTISAPVIDRMDEIIPFRAPTRSEFKKVVMTQIARELKAISATKGAEYTLDNLEEYAEDVVKNNYVPGNGSREVGRVIKRELKTHLAHLILKSEPARGSDVKLQYNRAAVSAPGGAAAGSCSKFERIQQAIPAI